MDLTLPMRRIGRRLDSLCAVALVAGGLAACAGPQPQPIAYEPPPAAAPPALPEESATRYPQKVATYVETGLASWYGNAFKRKHTASGERFEMTGLTAAHRSLPMGTVVRVTNLSNGRSIRVRVNDRGPFLPGRIIDLSRSAAAFLDMKKSGVVPVRIEVFEGDQRESVAANLTLY